MRMSALAVGTVITIACAMWLRFAVVDWEVTSHMSPAMREHVQQLMRQPRENVNELWPVLQHYYDITYVLPGLANRDWLLLAAMIAVAIPVLVACGLLASRSLSRQFTHVAHAARQVAKGDFSSRALVEHCAPGELAGLATDFNDMTSRLEQYEREIRESSAMLAHELRTPLNAAMGRVQGVLDEVFPYDAQQLQLVLRQLEQINRLVGELHLLSLARAGQLHLELEEFALHELIEERLHWSALPLQEAGMAVRFDVPPELYVRADRQRLGQVLSILIDNAIRYAAGGHALDINARASTDGVQIALRDYGAGVPDEQLPRVFDRFWRAESSRARHSGGSGLGLSIAYAICKSHGGTLGVENLPGGGLQVTIRLP